MLRRAVSRRLLAPLLYRPIRRYESTKPDKQEFDVAGALYRIHVANAKHFAEMKEQVAAIEAKEPPFVDRVVKVYRQASWSKRLFWYPLMGSFAGQGIFRVLRFYWKLGEELWDLLLIVAAMVLEGFLIILRFILESVDSAWESAASGWRWLCKRLRRE